MTTRRYGDDEVREIFALATTGDAREQALPAEAGGLTLDEIQRIGHEAGIEPARVAEAARLLEVRGQRAPVQRSLGLPVGVSRVVDLPRAPTDREWDQLISRFRTTFDAQGQVTITGGLREWSNGNLHVSIEPTAEGHQLRLRTRSEAVVALNGVGFLMGGMSLLMTAVVTAAGKPEKALAVLTMFGGIAVAAFATNLLRAPRWAREREAQMEAIAAEVVRMLAAPDATPPADH